jgi:hypothetical protein
MKILKDETALKVSKINFAYSSLLLKVAPSSKENGATKAKLYGH